MTNSRISHRQRIETCLSGELPDRTPVALWRHFPVDDQRPGSLAAAVANFQHTYDFDLIKVTPASSYCIKDWGAADRWEGNPEGTRRYLEPVITHPDDWMDLPSLNPRKGALGDTLETLRMVVSEFGNDTPILHTIFNPLSQAKNLAGKENLQVHLRRSPEAFLAGLERITETTLEFLDAVRKTGVTGIFYAVQHAQLNQLSEEEFDRFSRPFDLRILQAASDLPFNLLHLHGTDVMFQHIVDYPVQMINWHDRQTQPTLANAKLEFPGVVVGGLRQWETMVLGTPGDVLAEASDAVEQTGGKCFILGTGCVLPITAPYGNIMAARRFAGMS